MKSPSNASGNTVRVNRQREMAVFDALPPQLRALVRESSANLEVAPMAEALVAGAPLHSVARFVIADHNSRMAAYRREYLR